MSLLYVSETEGSSNSGNKQKLLTNFGLIPVCDRYEGKKGSEVSPGVWGFAPVSACCRCCSCLRSQQERWLIRRPSEASPGVWVFPPGKMAHTKQFQPVAAVVAASGRSRKDGSYQAVSACCRCCRCLRSQQERWLVRNPERTFLGVLGFLQERWLIRGSFSLLPLL
jgi:hypothetical protein